MLARILESVKSQIAQQKKRVAQEELMKQLNSSSATRNFKHNISKSHQINLIAEIKRSSPTKGIIRKDFDPIGIARTFWVNGVAALSVLTEREFFGGQLEYITEIKNAVSLPILRKDFIIDEYQVYETKFYGADVMLLIAANLEVNQCHHLAAKAKELGLEVLLELHVEEELNHISDNIDMVGINNRNLKTFRVDLEHSIRLAEKIPNTFVKIAESGISDPSNIKMLKQHGFKGFLIGETFMKTNDPAKACKDFIRELNVN